MADIVVDGFTRIDYVAALASKGVPKVTELSAGIPLSSAIMLASGMQNWKGTVADVDNTRMGSTFSTSRPGRTSFDNPSLMFARDDSFAADPVFTALKAKGTNGFIVIRDGKPYTGVWTVGDVVDVYPVASGGYTGMEDREANSLLRWQCAFKVTGEPALAVAMVA